MPRVEVREVKFWRRIGGCRERGLMYQRRAEGKAVVARIWPVERTARFSKPLLLVRLKRGWTGAVGVAVGGK